MESGASQDNCQQSFNLSVYFLLFNTTSHTNFWYPHTFPVLYLDLLKYKQVEQDIFVGVQISLGVLKTQHFHRKPEKGLCRPSSIF